MSSPALTSSWACVLQFYKTAETLVKGIWHYYGFYALDDQNTPHFSSLWQYVKEELHNALMDTLGPVEATRTQDKVHTMQ